MAAQPLTPLRDMIKASRLSFPDLTKAAIDPETGTTASQTYLHNLASGNAPTIPSPGRIGAIAAALGRPYELVWSAAIIEFMPPRDDESRAVLIAEFTAQLQADDERRAVAVAERARRAVAAAGDVPTERPKSA